MHATSATLLAFAPLRLAVENALDEGVFYETDFRKACRHAWDEATPASNQRLPSISISSDEDFAARRATRDGAVARVAASPRGTWMVLIKQRPAPERPGTTFESLMSDGHGNANARSDGWQSEPTYEAVLDRMVGYEIYTARNAVEAERRAAAGAARLVELGIHQGIQLRNVTVNGCERFSTAIVKEVYPDNGGLVLYATRRGSSKRYEVTTNALAIKIDPPASRANATHRSVSSTDMFVTA